MPKNTFLKFFLQLRVRVERKPSQGDPIPSQLEPRNVFQQEVHAIQDDEDVLQRACHLERQAAGVLDGEVGRQIDL